jgi:hypothetical protein
VVVGETKGPVGEHRNCPLFLKRDADGGLGNKFNYSRLRFTNTTLPDLGDPVNSTTYTLRILDDGVEILTMTVPPGPNWRAFGAKGFKYTDSHKTFDGVFRIVLKLVKNNELKIVWRAKGANLLMPPLPLNQSVGITVRMENSLGEVWQLVYGPPSIRNDDTKFLDNTF